MSIMGDFPPIWCDHLTKKRSMTMCCGTKGSTHGMPSVELRLVKRLRKYTRITVGADKIYTILIQQVKCVSMRFVASIRQDIGLVSMSPTIRKDYKRLAVSIPQKNTLYQ